MKIYVPQTYSLEKYKIARQCFQRGQFALANRYLREYQRTISYDEFHSYDNRGSAAGRSSVIIVTRDRGPDLLNCLNSLNEQIGPRFETIVVNNGGNQTLRETLCAQKVLLIECPFAFTPSEGRNIGASYARTDILVFLDDDSIAEKNFIKVIVNAFDNYQFLGIRGRIIPKTIGCKHNTAGVYDLGKFPLPAILDVEGNMAVSRHAYRAVGGMDPLIFGGEGLDLTNRLLMSSPEGDVYYLPNMIIRHDYASGNRLLSKRKRQILTNEYFRVMSPNALKVKKQYSEWYTHWNKTNKNIKLNILPSKLEAFAKEIKLTLESEKHVFAFHRESIPRTEAFFLTDDSSSSPINAVDSKILLQRVYHLEYELERIRKTLLFRLENLKNEFLASPLRQCPMLFIRLARLIKENFNKPKR